MYRFDFFQSLRYSAASTGPCRGLLMNGVIGVKGVLCRELFPVAFEVPIGR